MGSQSERTEEGIMSTFIDKEMDNRGVRDSVSVSAISEKLHIPWSDKQNAQDDRHSNPDHGNSESPRIDVNVGFLIAGGECS